jgi:hypothetical protein
MFDGAVWPSRAHHRNYNANIIRVFEYSTAKSIVKNMTVFHCTNYRATAGKEFECKTIWRLKIQRSLTIAILIPSFFEQLRSLQGQFTHIAGSKQVNLRSMMENLRFANFQRSRGSFQARPSAGSTRITDSRSTLIVSHHGPQHVSNSTSSQYQT